MKYLPFILIFSALSCTTDVLPEPEPTVCDGIMPSYEVDIRPILEASCSYSGCHLGGSNTTYADYGDLITSIESGVFRDRIITQRSDEVIGMPPNYAPDNRPKDLTADEILLIECWLDAGYPEN